MTSNSGKMMIVFMTNSTNTDSGWEGSYSVVQTGITDLASSQKIVLFPVPAHDRVSVEFGRGPSLPVRLELISSTGQMVRLVNDNTPVAGIINMDISGIAPGIYFMKITTDQETTTRKVLIN